jgi:hypothetical protein
MGSSIGQRVEPVLDGNSEAGGGDLEFGDVSDGDEVHELGFDVVVEGRGIVGVSAGVGLRLGVPRRRSETLALRAAVPVAIEGHVRMTAVECWRENPGPISLAEDDRAVTDP